MFDLATAWLIERKILLPGVSVLARLVASVRDRAAARLWHTVSAIPSEEQRTRLDGLLVVPAGARASALDRLRRAPTRASAPFLVDALKRLREVRDLGVSRLDLSHIPAETLDRKLGAILEIYEMFVGDDPRHVPMRIFPGVHYSMGGLWVDFNQRTNIPGLLAAGECDYSIHGANRLGANSLVSCVYGGFIAAPAAIEYAKNVQRKPAASQ